MEPQVSINVQVNFLPNETMLIREVYTSPREKVEEKVLEHITPNLTGVDFASVPLLAFVTAL